MSCTKAREGCPSFRQQCEIAGLEYALAPEPAISEDNMYTLWEMCRVTHDPRTQRTVLDFDERHMIWRVMPGEQGWVMRGPNGREVTIPRGELYSIIYRAIRTYLYNQQ